MSGFFVTGTDTNVGKTLLSALLVAALDGVYWKPIQTGAWEGIDREAVMRWAEITADSAIAETYLFDPPVSPHLAAEESGVTIELDLIAKAVPNVQRPLIVEGAGGILVPINNTQTMLDLALAVKLPVIVASRSALGTINHTSLTVNALRNAGADVRGVVMIGKENKSNEQAVEGFAKALIIGRIPHLDHIHRAELLKVFHSQFSAKYFQT
jgi:dethiobiotin synthetase